MLEFADPAASAPAQVAAEAACAGAPRAVVCGESVLALHELIDGIPAAAHIAVPRGTCRPTTSFPPTVVAQYAAKTFDLGLERFEAAPGETIPMYKAVRSVVDAMRHRSRLGETLALSAQQLRVRRLRGVCPAVHPTGQFVYPRFCGQVRQIAGEGMGLTRLPRRECGGEAGQPLFQT
ncbi:hypothetical protein [Streptomyces sp. 900105755]